MARVPPEEIDRIKREVSIERLVQAHGIELKPHGKNLVGRCIWHDDKTPSLVITPDKNLWHCLGKCNVGGSVIDWVMCAHKVSYRHALEILRSDQLPATTMQPVTASAPMLPPPVDFTADDQVLFRQVVTYYHETLKRCPEALAYLKQRGIDSPDIIERYQLGFANRTLGLRLPDKTTKAGREIRGRLQALGILRQSGHEHFNGSLVIPVLDEHGNVREMYGRKITEGLRAGTPDHLYLPDHGKRGVFNVEAFKRYSEIILCESLIDALTFLNAGFPNVSCTYGVNGVTDEHLAAFARIKRVLIAYDRDDAGDSAAEHLAKTVLLAGLECFRIQFPRGMDANEYALKVQPATKSLGLVIRKAVWMGKGAAPARADETPLVEGLTQEPEPLVAAASVVEVRAAPPAATKPAPMPHGVPVPAAPVPPPPAAPSVPPPPTSAPAPALPASPEPPRPPAPPAHDRDGKAIRFTLGDRHYRILGLEKNVDVGVMKVNVFVIRGEQFHMDTIDMCLAPKRAGFSRDAALELGLADETIRKDLGRLLLALETIRAQDLEAALAPENPDAQMTPEDERDALEFLRDPRLLDRILEDFRASGVVGEEVNKLVGYVAAVSRNLDMPLAVVIQSSSAAGKSSLMDAILAFIPREHYDKYSAMTGQSLFYMGETNLKNKVLAIAEEEGAERASYALKLLQSEGELTIASTGKDPATGRHVTHEYHVEGPVMIFLTTTAVEIDEELLNRCVVLTVDEDRGHTRTIHKMQRERQTLEGLLKRRDVSKIIKRHQNAQRLLRPLLVANGYAPQLTFRDDQTRMRRDHGKYLTLIRATALLHQYQRPIHKVSHEGQELEYIEVTREDIRVANRLAHEVLGRTLDELPPQTRRMLERLHDWVNRECERLGMDRADFRFQRWEVRALGWGITQAREHLDKLVEFEYVVVHRGTRGQTFVYELVYDGQGQDGQRFLMGLTDPDTLVEPADYDEKLAGSTPELADEGRPHIGPKSAGWRTAARAPEAPPDQPSGESDPESAKNTVPEPAPDEAPSYPHNAPATGPGRKP